MKSTRIYSAIYALTMNMKKMIKLLFVIFVMLQLIKAAMVGKS